jgi:hypothetical protein
MSFSLDKRPRGAVYGPRVTSPDSYASIVLWAVIFPIQTAVVHAENADVIEPMYFIVNAVILAGGIGLNTLGAPHATGRTLPSALPWSNTLSSAAVTRALRIGSHVDERNATRSSSRDTSIGGGLLFASSDSIRGSSARASSVNCRQ